MKKNKKFQTVYENILSDEGGNFIIVRLNIRLYL